MSEQSTIIPVSTYNLALKPYDPTPAIAEAYPMSITITMAALDPEAVDDDDEPSTLRLMKKKFDAEDYEDEDDSELDSEEDELDEEEEEEEEEKPKKSSKGEKKSKNIKVEKGEENAEEESSEEDEEEDEEDEEIEEFVICTLSPKIQYQQTLELTINPYEEVYFVVTGSYPVHLSGNYITHPYDSESDESDEDYDDLIDGDYDDEEYDLTPDEDEIIDLPEGKILEIEEEEEEEEEEPKPEPKKSKKEKKKENKKRVAEEEKEEEKEKPAKKSKKESKEVKFNKDLEQGPSGSQKKVVKQTLSAGVVVEDRTSGEGAKAKSGNRVSVRYVGKLKNGKVFDKNVKGKPFSFKLGKGEVIRGWDLGIQGMAVGGERRIIIPAAAAYGSQALPGIPSNSELTFDVKLLSIK